MNGVAQGIATRYGQEDSASVMSFRSRGVQMSMATSLAAHVALGFALMAMMPERSISLGAPSTDAVVMLDMATSASVSKLVVALPDAKAVELKMPTDGPKHAWLPEVENAEVLLKPTPVHVAQKSTKAAPQHMAATDHPSRVSHVSYAAQSEGARSAPVSKHGAGAERELIITNPRYRENPKPAVYPKRSRDLGQQGIVFVRARLDFEGNAEEVMVLKSSGHVLLDNSALAAVRRWHFEPGRRNGTPVVAWVHVPVRFTLN